jgi:hypothetical protein
VPFKAVSQDSVPFSSRRRLLAGRRFIRILAVVNDFTRENLALVVDTSLSGADIARELDAISAVRRTPLMIVPITAPS